MRVLLATVAASAIVCVPAAQGVVWRVDLNANPVVPPDFTDLQPAIDAAMTGDAIVLVPGESSFQRYGPATVDGKGLNLVSSEVGGPARVVGLTVQNVSVGLRASLRGLDVGALSLDGCAGEVLVEDAEVGTLDADACTELVLTRVTTSQSAVLQASGIACFGCSFQGGAGTPASGFCTQLGGPFGGGPIVVDWETSTPGTHGLEVLGGSAATLVGCQVTGGDGGSGYPEVLLDCGFGVSGTVPCLLASSGGDGLVVRSGALVRHFGTTFQAGSPGFAFSCGGGGPSDPIVGAGVTEGLPALPGSSTPSTPADVRTTEGTSPLQNGGTTDFTFTGPPGDVVYLQYSQDVLPQYVTALSGVWISHPAGFLLSPGAVPASGELAVAFTVNVPMTAEFEQFHGQGFFVRLVQGSVVVWAGSPTSVTLLQ